MEVELIGVEDVAKMFGVTTKVIYNAIERKKKGEPGISENLYMKMGRKLFFVKSKVEEAILSNTFIS